MKPPAEQVLVIPAARFRALGEFQGLRTDPAEYLPRLLDPAHLLFMDRGLAELDPGHKQLIPYVVLRCGRTIFHYRRGHRGNEARLHALWSVGIGGHINPVDTGPDPYRAGMLRELAEEVDLGSTFVERPLGVINDDGTPVGRVHLGIAHVLDLAEPRVSLRDPTLTDAGFAPLETLRARAAGFETWSRFLFDLL